MCGKYYFDSCTYKTLKTLVSEDDCDENGDIDFCPGKNIPVIIFKDYKMVMQTYSWGFSLPQSLVINARCETLLEKPLFKEHIKTHRCIIPAKGFYEWDIHKRKFSFESNDILYMCGIYREIEQDVVIITTQANQTMKPIHSRMPLIILKEEIDIWFNNEKFDILLRKQIKDLMIVSGIKQQSLFDE